MHVMFAESSSRSFSSLAVNLSLPQLQLVQLERSSLSARGITRVDYSVTSKFISNSVTLFGLSRNLSFMLFWWLISSCYRL